MKKRVFLAVFAAIGIACAGLRLLHHAAAPSVSKPIAPVPVPDPHDFPGDSHQILENGERFTLLSLSPYGFEGDGKTFFHHYPVLGQTQITDPAERALLLAALDEGMASSGDGKMCFEPRHGLRAVQGNRQIDMVICFGCGSIYTYIDGHKKRIISGVSHQPGAAFDAALKKAGVPLTKN